MPSLCGKKEGVMKIFSNLCLMLAVFALALLGATNVTEAGPLKRQSLLTGVTPEPQEVYEFTITEASFAFNNDTVILVKHTEDRIGAELLQNDLRERFGLKTAIIEGEVGKEVSSFVLLERSGNDEGVNHPALRKLGATQEEGYRMVVEGERCIIQGHDARGALYGIQTLRQLILSDATVAPIAIRDWPEMQWRVSYCGLFRDIENIKAHVRRCARLKMNAVILESYWNGPQNWWYNHTGGRQQLAQQFFDECRRYHIEPIPLVQGFGWGYGVTDLEPMAAEGVWGENESVVLYYDKGTDLNRPNVVTTPDTAPIVVTSKSGEPYEPGVDFEIIPGLTRRPYKEDNKRWQLRALPGGKIADGQTVLVDYNAVTPGTHKSYCPAEPRTYELVDRTIDRVMKIYQPDVIHIGHDELFNSMTDSRCLNSGMTKTQLVLRDVMHWYDRIKMHNPDATIMMWSDLLQHREGDRKGPLLEVVDQLPKDIVMCPWIYGTSRKHTDRMPVEVDYQQKHGFQTIGTAAGYKLNNILDWYHVLAGKLTPDKGSVLGMMFSYWGDGVLLQSGLPISAEFMWSGKKLNLDLFNRFKCASSQLKRRGLALTFDLDTQKKVLVDQFNSELLSGRIPHEIASEFRASVLGDEQFFIDMYGAKRWEELRGVVFAEQYAGMIQKLPLFFDAMAIYAEIEYELSRGKNTNIAAQITTLIDVLEQIDCLDKSRASRLKGIGEGMLPRSEEIFGYTLNRYRPSGADKNLIITPIPGVIIQQELTADYEQIQFKRPVALSRITGTGLDNRTILISSDGESFTGLKVTDNLAMAGGERVSIIRLAPATVGKLKFYEQRQPAIIRSDFADPAPTIDGELNDQVWQNTSAATGFLTPYGHQAIQQTRVQVTWDQENLYVAFRCERRPSESIKSDCLQFDGPVYEDESIQLFLDTNLDQQSYYQIAINTSGIVMDRHSIKGGGWDSNANVAAKIKEKFWIAEMAIPLSSLNVTGDLSTKSWGINFCRSQWGSARVNSTWALLNPGQAYFFLQPAAFGKIEFKQRGKR